MSNNRLLVLSALLMVLAGSLIFMVGYVAGPVHSGQAGGEERGAQSSPAAWPERMTDPALLTALANLPGSVGNPAIVATAEPTPENTPWPKKDTPVPWPSCPQSSGICQWPEPVAPTRIVPTSTPYPTCSTPIPGDRCRIANE